MELYYLQSRYYDPELCRFLNADAFISTGQGELGNNMFAYCRNNPVCRVDITGTEDQISYNDGELLTADDLEQHATGGGGASVGTPSNTVGGQHGNMIQKSGTGQAPKQSTPNSTYTQYSSDGKNSLVSQTTYNEYGVPGQRIDFQGRDHGVGLPHIHVFSWAIRDGNLYRTGEGVYLYVMP